jgi:hypothetical protein
MPGIGQIAMGRQQVGQAAHLAPAHRIRLPGQRERPGTGLANLAGSQMQMNDAGVVVRAVCRLVQPLAVQRQRRTALAEPAGGLDDVPGANAAYFGHCFRGVALDDLGQWREAVGVARDVVRIDEAFGNEHMQHAVEQRDVGTRFDGQVQVGDLGRLRPAGSATMIFRSGLAARASSIMRNTIGWATAGFAPAMKITSACRISS